MKCQSCKTNLQTLRVPLSCIYDYNFSNGVPTPTLCPQSALDEMMVEQTDLVRLRLVRMSNVPDTLYMVNNAVPQCCHMINHQQMIGNSSTAPSVVANEIPGK